MGGQDILMEMGRGKSYGMWNGQRTDQEVEGEEEEEEHVEVGN